MNKVSDKNKQIWTLDKASKKYEEQTKKIKDLNLQIENEKKKATDFEKQLELVDKKRDPVI